MYLLELPFRPFGNQRCSISFEDSGSKNEAFYYHLKLPLERLEPEFAAQTPDAYP